MGSHRDITQARCIGLRARGMRAGTSEVPQSVASACCAGDTHHPDMVCSGSVRRAESECRLYGAAVSTAVVRAQQTGRARVPLTQPLEPDVTREPPRHASRLTDRDPRTPRSCIVTKAEGPEIQPSAAVPML